MYNRYQQMKEMKKMKEKKWTRALALILIIAMVMGLAACSKDKQEPQGGNDQEQVETPGDAGEENGGTSDDPADEDPDAEDPDAEASSPGDDAQDPSDDSQKPGVGIVIPKPDTGDDDDDDDQTSSDPNGGTSDSGSTGSAGGSTSKPSTGSGSSGSSGSGNKPSTGSSGSSGSGSSGSSGSSGGSTSKPSSGSSGSSTSKPSDDNSDNAGSGGNTSEDPSSGSGSTSVDTPQSGESIGLTPLEAIDKIYEARPVDLGSLDSHEQALDDADMVKFNTGLTDTSKVKAIGVSAPMISSQAYSLVVVQVNDSKDTQAVASEMLSGIDPKKWVCVVAEDVQVAWSGDLIMLFMVGNDLSDVVTGDEMVAAFETVCGGLAGKSAK